MPEFTCPQCHAGVEAGLIDETGRAECPFCGADLSELGLPQSDIGGVVQPESNPVARDAAGTDLPAVGELSRPVARPPADSAIQVIESTAERLVLHIPAGGKGSAGIGCFAVLWNGFMLLFTAAFVGAGFKAQNQPPPGAGLFVFLALFWAVGLGMSYFWLKMKFERTFVLLDRERIAVQKSLLGRKKVHETALGPRARAELVESYQQNDNPVYRVEVSGPGGAAKFGTALSNPEKDWLVDCINGFLDAGDEQAEVGGQRSDVRSQRSEGRGQEGGVRDQESGDRGQDGEAPSTDAVLEVVESSPERLLFWYAVAPNSTLRWAVPAFLIPFGLVWMGGVALVVWNVARPFGVGSILPLVFSIPFMGAGLLLFAMGCYARWGMTTIELTPARLACRWSVGPLGFTRSLPTPEITRVGIEYGEGVHNRPRSARKGRVRDSGTGSANNLSCVARTPAKKVTLVFFNDEPLARQISSLLRTALENMGHPLGHG